MKKLHITLCLMTMALLGRAQTLTVQAPSTVGVGEQFSVSFSVEARADDFKGPTFKGFSVLGGPSTSTSRSISWQNGKTTNRVEYEFRYYVSADEEGLFTIGSASCLVDGKRIKSQPFTVKVEKGSPRANQRGGGSGWGGRPSQPQGQARPTQIDANSLYARATISNAHPYQGEQVIITYKIYTQVSLQNFQLEKLPGNKGFWSEDLSEGKQVRTYDETINGRRYRVAEIRRGAMFAQESGKLRIEPLEMDVLAVVPRQRQRTGTIWDLFDDPFFNSAQAVEKHLVTNALSVNVRPLPTPPAGFGGAVGAFSVKAEVDNARVRANEAITYRITVSGRGNLPLIQAPQIKFPPVFEVYEPQVVDKIQRTDGGVSGSRTFEWVLIPRSQGDYELPALEYVYFSPASGRYETVRRPAIAVKVDKGDPNAKTVASAGQDVRLLNADINHIKPHTRLLPADSARRVPPLRWVLLALPVLLAAMAVWAGRRQQRMRADEKGMRLRHATKLAQRRLRDAERYLHGGDDTRFYEEIYKALWGCISDKYGIDLSQLGRDTVEAKLNENSIPAQQRDRIMRTLREVDEARFAPGDSSARKREIYNEAVETIVVL